MKTWTCVLCGDLGTGQTLGDALDGYVEHYNEQHLHAAVPA